VTAEEALLALSEFRNSHFDPQVLEVLANLHQPAPTGDYMKADFASDSVMLIDEPFNELDVIHAG
jgi:hypothetical protein